MIAFFKYLKGYVRIRVWGFSPERFMNLCSNRNILLWDIKKEGETYYMCISLRAFYELRTIVRKTGTKVAIQKRYGLPFFMPKVRKRKIFLLGFLASVLFWIWTSCYIWSIDISGNYSVTTDIFMDFLEEHQVHTGMKKSQLDIETLEKEIRRKFDVVTWTSAKLSGTKLFIQIKENEIVPEEIAEDTMQGSDLVAENDGIITSMIVRRGVPQVSIGQAVKKGDILVSGSVPVYNEDATIRKYQYCRADADISIEHTIQMQAKLPFLYEKKEYTGREKKVYYCHMMGKEYTIPGRKNKFLLYDMVNREQQLQILPNLFAPIYYGSYTYREYYKKECKYALKEAEHILQDELEKFIASLDEKGVQIIEKNVKIDTSSSMWILSGYFHVVESTGKSKEITIEPEQETEMETTEQDE